MITNSLKGKRALVAGSTKGIGLAIAQQLSASGADCTLISRNADLLKKAVETLPNNGAQNHDYLVADFTNYQQVENVVTDYLTGSTISILINNTGGPPGGPIFDAEPEAFLTAFKQHLITNQLLAKAVVPGMKNAGFGRIINIISTSVKMPIKNLGVSNTIRGAVASWAKTLSNELAPFGITVNNVLPGFTATARLESIIQKRTQETDQSRDTVEASMKAQVPMARFGQPEEIAAVAAFLASPAASYLTGVSIPVDGGRTGCL